MNAEGARRKPAVRLSLFRARRVGAALLLAALALPALPSTGAAEPPADAAVLDAFAKIALGNEFAAEPDPRLKKWTQPVRWRSYAELPLEGGERDFLDRHLERLRRLTGLDFAEAGRWPETNFAILFVREDRFEYWIDRYIEPSRRSMLARLARSACLGFLRHHRVTFEIEFAVAIIPVERARARGLMQSCIAEETTQVLGLLNDVDMPGTLFNDTGKPRDLTPLDELLVRLLYHPGLRPGMRRGEALAAARRALPALRGGAR